MAAIPAVAALIRPAAEQNTKPVRRALPEHLEREEIVHPEQAPPVMCGALRKIGTDVIPQAKTNKKAPGFPHPRRLI
jgi:hypothetical protein